MCGFGGFRLLFRSENARFCANPKAGSFLIFLECRRPVSKNGKA
ncbi:hypothetical protein HMPREF9720_0988 [Alistipes sp. HGB5]|nr:hypothetical protein HMPREF9720_0988 [Alistipes sp. HGB5]